METQKLSERESKALAIATHTKLVQAQQHLDRPFHEFEKEMNRLRLLADLEEPE